MGKLEITLLYANGVPYIQVSDVIIFLQDYISTSNEPNVSNVLAAFIPLLKIK